MAFIAVTEEDAKETEIGVARYVTNPDGETCEFALVVADAWQRKGIGSGLMEQLMEVARSRGLKTIEGEVLTASNEEMLALVKILGFSIHPRDDDPAIRHVSRRL
jgi:acetyltransferase